MLSIGARFRTRQPRYKEAQFNEGLMRRDEPQVAAPPG